MNNWKTFDASISIGSAGRVLLRSLVFLILAVVSVTAALAGQETPKQSVEFRWKLIKLGAMDFEIGPAFFSKAAANAGEFGQPLFANDEARLSVSEGARAPVHLAVTGITIGPLRWFKNYQARAELYVQGQSRTFVLAGEDNGVYEERALVFALGLPPEVESFIDSTAPEPLEVQSAWKHDTVDPLTVFEWMIFSAVQGQSCAKQFWIYDGKRRYAAQTADLADKIADNAGQNARLKTDIVFEKNRRISCRLTLSGGSLNKKSFEKEFKGAEKSAGTLTSAQMADSSAVRKYDDGGKRDVIPVKAQGKVGWGAVWPFGKGDRDIVFGFIVCRDEQVIVESVEMASPVGRILGASQSQCGSTL